MRLIRKVIEVLSGGCRGRSQKGQKGAIFHEQNVNKLAFFTNLVFTTA